MRRFLGFVVWASGIVLVSVPIVGAVGEIGCGGCYGKSCLCPDGTTQPTTNGPCGCGVACEGHNTPPSDASTDASTDASSEGGGLGQGSLCNIQNDKCGSGLKCCTEPTHIPDASTNDICVPPEDGGVCPAYP